MKIAIYVCLSFISMSCAMFYVQESDNQLGSGVCETNFKQQKLAVKYSASAAPSSEIELAAVGVFVASTFLVSSAWVITENTVGWLEYHGKCDESFLKKQVNRYKNTSEIEHKPAEQNTIESNV